MPRDVDSPTLLDTKRRFYTIQLQISERFLGRLLLVGRYLEGILSFRGPDQALNATDHSLPMKLK